jgi:hypothetical protein
MSFSADVYSAVTLRSVHKQPSPQLSQEFLDSAVRFHGAVLLLSASLMLGYAVGYRPYACGWAWQLAAESFMWTFVLSRLSRQSARWSQSSNTDASTHGLELTTSAASYPAPRKSTPVVNDDSKVTAPLLIVYGTPNGHSQAQQHTVATSHPSVVTSIFSALQLMTVVLLGLMQIGCWIQAVGT